MTVDLFIPCYVDQLFPETGLNMVKILHHLKIKTNYNKNQTCCGQVAFNSGYWKESKEICLKFINDFTTSNPIVCPGASCVSYIKNHYSKLVGDTILINNYTKIRNNIFELSDFIVNRLKITKIKSNFPYSVTFHDSCSALREYGIKEQPRLLLQNIEKLELIEMPESETCCGFGGTFSIKFTDISTAMTEQKVLNALSTGAEYITSTEMSCLMNIKSYVDKNKINLKVVHIADILASGL